MRSAIVEALMDDAARREAERSVTTWNAGEIEAYRLFSRWTREEALAVFAWDAASVRGEAVGERPTITPHVALQARAREAVR